MIDLKIYDTDDGGDIFLRGNDMVTVEGFVNMPYIAMFGGNVKENTPARREVGQQAFDYWGNAFLANEAIQYNSNTERVLQEVALSSSGRILIEEAVKKDLQFMQAFAEVTISVEVTGNDKIQINIKIQEPDNLQAKQFVYVWDGTLTDLTVNENNFQVVSEYQSYIYNVIETQARNYILWR